MAKKKWIQAAFKKAKAKGTTGRCTGKKFGSSSCPSGSKAYNMAKTLRKINKKQEGGQIDYNQVQRLKALYKPIKGQLHNLAATSSNVGMQALPLIFKGTQRDLESPDEAAIGKRLQVHERNIPPMSDELELAQSYVNKLTPDQMNYMWETPFPTKGFGEGGGIQYLKGLGKAGNVKYGAKDYWNFAKISKHVNTLKKEGYTFQEGGDIEEKSLGGILASTGAGAATGAIGGGGALSVPGAIVGGVVGLGTGLFHHFRERKMEKEAAYQERFRVDMEKDRLESRNKFFASQLQDNNTMSFAPTFPMGGYVGEPNVELEKEEVFQEPGGQMGKVNAPSHEYGGIEINLPDGTKIFSDDPELKTSRGGTFADEANDIKRQMSKYERIFN